MRLGAKVVDTLLLGAGGRRRELQDFPVLGDVWARFADEPGEPHDLLITPTWEKPAGTVAKLVARTGLDDGEEGPYRRGVAYLQDVVVASLSLDDLTGVAIPLTKWWDEIEDQWEAPSDAALRQWIERELEDALADEQPHAPLSIGGPERRPALSTEQRQVAKLGLMLGVLRAAAAKPAADTSASEAEASQAPEGSAGDPPSTVAAAQEVLGRGEILQMGVDAVRLVIDRYGALPDNEPWNGVIFQVSLNRPASPAAADSVAAIKADAALSLFSITCRDISWAILDSGIDRNHPAFLDHERIRSQTAPISTPPVEGGGEASGLPLPHRIKATFDFRQIRAIMSVGGPDQNLVDDIGTQSGLDREAVEKALEDLAADREAGVRTNWAKVRPLIEQANPAPPPHPHGTHVAGILGANWLDDKKSEAPGRTDAVKMAGVCPDITLYDFRVLGSNQGDSEFAVIAALQFIRYLNDQSGYSVIHGVNMSLSIPHNVRNYACGRTPVCIESEALVANGVVVVTAAGNRGFQQYLLADNTLFESYAASSITDPGNAEGVITVGATHRLWPHTYGVSFFSSRGPTGDGRLKPDLLAPGEKIVSCIPGGRSDQMDGTSMAAPHVSGAAALLMARHPELKGQPARIKQILCETATDLNRERSFQGHGMVDVLRAIQSV